MLGAVRVVDALHLGNERVIGAWEHDGGDGNRGAPAGYAPAAGDRGLRGALRDRRC